MPDEPATITKPSIDDPYHALVNETVLAVTQVASALDAHTKQLARVDSVIQRANAALERIAAAEEAAVAAQQGRWADLKSVALALWSNTFFAGAVTLAMSMLAIGLVLWVLTLLGVDVGQVAEWLGLAADASEALPQTTDGVTMETGVTP